MCSCAGIGCSAAHRLLRREQRWQAWEQLLLRLHGLLSYSGASVQSLLAEMPKEDLCALTWLRSYRADDRLTVPQGLSREERAFAQTVFQTLGTTDLEGQLSHLAYCARRASEYKEAARLRALKSAKVYASMGICAGISIGLLLI
ncbi:MAG: hypothetical protein IJD01_05905 [Clostridia bacterium]|nr:hypothetical protein [Clostridia bacterium]